jgi:hypothetical protein
MDTAVSEMQGMNTMQYKYADTCIKLSYNHAILQYHMYKYPPHPRNRVRVTGRKKKENRKRKPCSCRHRHGARAGNPGPESREVYIFMCVYVGYHARTEPPKGPTCFVLESHRFGKNIWN